jgi:apolipoprotein D and lipocalin family protein
MKSILICFFVGIIFSTGCSSQNLSIMINNTTVKQLSLDRYLGVWYEIGRFPNKFEKDMVAVTATYTLRQDGKINVINQGKLKTLDGKLKIARGKAKMPNKNEPGKLKVSFFLFFYADYFIMDLDQENYQWALIGSSTPDYLWILSRTPHMTEDTYQKVLTKAKDRGYNTDKIIKVEQP